LLPFALHVLPISFSLIQSLQFYEGSSTYSAHFVTFTFSFSDQNMFLSTVYPKRGKVLHAYETSKTMLHIF
jgi:hypothetical protein